MIVSYSIHPLPLGRFMHLEVPSVSLMWSDGYEQHLRDNKKIYSCFKNNLPTC